MTLDIWEMSFYEAAWRGLWSPTGLNVMAGTAAGLAGVVAGHPFDTIKVRLQNMKNNCQDNVKMPENTGNGNGKRGMTRTLPPLSTRASVPTTLQTLVTIVKNEKIRGLFKGMMAPMAGVITINAFLFGLYGFLLDIQMTEKGEASSSSSSISPTLLQTFWAGLGSGLGNSLISCPTELAKIQLQVQINNIRYKGPLDCLIKIYKTSGVTNGCFRGMVSTLLREGPSYGVYFATFEWLRGMWTDKDGNISGWKLMMAGGLSGITGWLSTYPVDVIKTKIQAQEFDKPPIYRGTIDCFKKSIQTEGWRIMFRGLTATMIRAFPTNAVIFYTYAITMNLLERIHPFNSKSGNGNAIDSQSNIGNSINGHDSGNNKNRNIIE